MSMNGIYGFLGYGNMGEAIVSGLISRNVVRPEQVLVHDLVPARMEAARQVGVQCAESPGALAERCDMLLLAVKPQQMDDALAPVLDKIRPDSCILSIMAGVSIAALQKRFGVQAHIIRVMPNTPALVGAGVAGLAHSDACTQEDIDVGCAFFSAVGIVEVVPESFLDAVTALSGSGPAYFFYLTECLIKGACAEGLPEPLARRFAAHTLMGAGKLLVESGATPDALRERVTSKGGTTFAALETMRSGRFEETVVAAVHAATARSRELGKSSS